MANHLYACDWECGVKLAAANANINNMHPDEQMKNLAPIVYYSTNTVFRKKLQFMIMRSHRQTCITAMKFSILSLNSFSGVCT